MTVATSVWLACEGRQVLAGHGSKISRKQEAAIPALLSQRNLRPKWESGPCTDG